MSHKLEAWAITEFVKEYVNEKYSYNLTNDEIQKNFGNCYNYFSDLSSHKIKLENSENLSIYFDKDNKEIRPFISHKLLKYNINLIRSSILLTALVNINFRNFESNLKEFSEWSKKNENLFCITGVFISFNNLNEGFRYHPKDIYEYLKNKADFDFLIGLKNEIIKFGFGCSVNFEELNKLDEWEIYQLYTYRLELFRYRECLYLFDKKLEESELMKNNNFNDNTILN